MIDLIDECGQDLAKYGYKVKEFNFYTRAYMHVDSDEKASRLGFRKGEYYIFNAKNVTSTRAAVRKALYSLLKNLGIGDKDKLLVVGLGNPNILADSLGAQTVDKVIDGGGNLFKFCPNIYAITGINTFDFVRFVKDGIGATCVIVIDSLASSSLGRLAHSIQLTTAGLSAGSGVGETNTRICAETLGVPTIAIGSPLILNLNDRLLTPKDIAEDCDKISTLIADAINDIVLSN